MRQRTKSLWSGLVCAGFLLGGLASSGAAQGTVSYCTSGVTASGCQAIVTTVGTPSATAPSGFVVRGYNTEGHKLGIFFYGTGGRTALPWGRAPGCTSMWCVKAPIIRGPGVQGSGTQGACDGVIQMDWNARWTLKPWQRPLEGQTVQMQLWHRDPFSPCTAAPLFYHTTGIAHAIEFTMGP